MAFLAKFRGTVPSNMVPLLFSCSNLSFLPTFTTLRKLPEILSKHHCYLLENGWDNEKRTGGSDISCQPLQKGLPAEEA